MAYHSVTWSTKEQEMKQSKNITRKLTNEKWKNASCALYRTYKYFIENENEVTVEDRHIRYKWRKITNRLFIGKQKWKNSVHNNEAYKKRRKWSQSTYCKDTPKLRCTKKALVGIWIECTTTMNRYWIYIQ